MLFRSTDGNAGNDYAVTFVTATGSITAKALTITGATAADRTYNGLATASVDVTGAALSGVVEGDAVTLVTTGVTATFPDKAVGAGRTVTFAGFAITGDDATNYALVQPTGLTVDITQAATTVTITCTPSVVYTGAAQTPCTASVTGAGGLDEALVVSYGPNTNVGTVNVSASYAGTTNYAADTDSTSFDITQKQLSVNAVEIGRAHV